MNKIPECYRNKLYQWCVIAPYDGCLWTTSFGLVDGSGDYHPINNGCDLNNNKWYKQALKDLDAKYKNDKTKLDTAKLELTYESQDRLNTMFYSTIKNAEEQAKSTDVYDKHIQNPFGASIEDFTSYNLDDEGYLDLCANLKGDAGMLCGVLDHIAKYNDSDGYNYDPICICTCCGKKFRASDIDCKFSDMIDPDAYHGNGGVGVVMTSVLCEDCYGLTECVCCGSHNLSYDNGAYNYANLPFTTAFMMQWLGICEYCSDRLFNDTPEHKAYLEDIEDKIATLADGVGKYIDAMRESGADESHLKELLKKTKEHTREMQLEYINEARDHLEQDVDRVYHSSLDSTARIDTNDINYYIGEYND